MRRSCQIGLSPSALIDAVSNTNVISPGGRIEAGNASFAVEPTGNFETVADIGDVVIEIPDRPGETVYLRDLVDIRRAYVDPPDSVARVNGKPTLAMAISMRPCMADCSCAISAMVFINAS